VLSISKPESSCKLNSRVFECINLCVVVENFSNTKKSTNNLLHEQECQCNSKFKNKKKKCGLTRLFYMLLTMEFTV
jgi:hypothetical protein